MEIQWDSTRQQVANALTNKGANPDLLMQLLNKGMIPDHTWLGRVKEISSSNIIKTKFYQNDIDVAQSNEHDINFNQ